MLAEVDARPHDEIGQALGVPRTKVNALVFRARESLVASRTAREGDCSEIRFQLATQRGRRCGGGSFSATRSLRGGRPYRRQRGSLRRR